MNYNTCHKISSTTLKLRLEMNDILQLLRKNDMNAFISPQSQHI